MLDELDSQVDSTTNRLGRAQRRMDKFIKDNQSKFAGACLALFRSWTDSILA